jgi:hypothetical protein
LPNVAVSYAEVGLADEKSAAMPRPRMVGVSGTVRGRGAASEGRGPPRCTGGAKGTGAAGRGRRRKRAAVILLADIPTDASANDEEAGEGDALAPRSVLPTLEKGGSTPSKKVLRLRSCSCAAASPGDTM